MWSRRAAARARRAPDRARWQLSSSTSATRASSCPRSTSGSRSTNGAVEALHRLIPRGMLATRLRPLPARPLRRARPRPLRGHLQLRPTPPRPPHPRPHPGRDRLPCRQGEDEMSRNRRHILVAVQGAGHPRKIVGATRRLERNAFPVVRAPVVDAAPASRLTLVDGRTFIRLHPPPGYATSWDMATAADFPQLTRFPRRGTIGIPPERLILRPCSRRAPAAPRPYSRSLALIT
jgi:hypothetical protein